MQRPVTSSRPRHSPDLIEKTLANLSGSMEQSLFAERIAHRSGLLQRLDPRTKVVAVLCLLLSVALSHSLIVLAGIYLLVLLLAWVSAVPLGFFVRRVWLLLPFFTALIALPAIFLTPGPPLAGLPLGIVITRTGVQAALFLLLRVAASVSTAVLLVLTTPWNTILNALGVLRVPEELILILGMTYRYIYLFLHLAGDLFLARRSRLVARLDPRAGRELVAASAGVLLSKSLQMSGEVYLAMQSRGFRGTPRTMDRFRLAPLDWAFATAVLLASAAAIWLGR
ncbi:MAG TPA: cobalt ECF transporter T component CbiQ [Anaerolineaceae bacterium]|nr:cobalt ECF transporter T component CbiQ [Anaerolineaceae bacterium]